MNSTWLAFVTLLLAALIAVAIGAQQIEAQQAAEISRLAEQRDAAERAALDAREQIESAIKARDEALAKVDNLTKEIASLQDDLLGVQSMSTIRQEEIARLIQQASELQGQILVLQARNQELEAQVAGLPQGSVPVTGTNDTDTVRHDTNFTKAISRGLPRQLGLGLGVLIGMAAIGSGGYLYYHYDPNRKYSVKMTREQIKDYARYQRERGYRVS